MNPSIGERLKSAREAKGTSLDEACQATKVQRRILQAIESNQLQDQLDPAYAKIFLKKYASYLGLDGPAVAKEFVSVYGPVPDRPVGLDTELTRKNVRGPSIQFQKFAVTLLLGFCVVAVLILVVSLSVGFYNRSKNISRLTDRKSVV